MKKNTSDLHIQFLLRFTSERNKGVVMFVDPNVCNSIITSGSETMIMKVTVSKYTTFIYDI
jgi:hypothetical protein